MTPIVEGEAWNLIDLLGRPMGRITEVSAKQFTIHPEGYAVETMASIEHGPFASLDAALRPSRSTRGRLPAQSGRGSTMVKSNPNLTLLRR